MGVYKADRIGVNREQPSTSCLCTLQSPYIVPGLVSMLFSWLLCNESYYGESIRHLDIRSGEHIGVSPFTGKKVKPIKNSAVRDHLLHCNYSPSFDEFSIVAHENKKFLPEIKEMRDK